MSCFRRSQCARGKVEEFGQLSVRCRSEDNLYTEDRVSHSSEDR